jgi:arginyl-tRNA synthetase
VRLCADGRLSLPEKVSSPDISEPKNKSHGDFTTNYALLIAKEAKLAPPQIGQLLAEELNHDDAIENAQVAGPGFVNIKLSQGFLSKWLRLALDEKALLSSIQSPSPERFLIEFVSVNPNGPIHVGHGRGAAFGDTLARILESIGNDVDREFYVNDGVNSLQMQKFALSVRAHYRKKLGLDAEFPEDGYKGDYVETIAEDILENYGTNHADHGLEFFQPISQDLMIDQQRKDLERFGVRFDRWFSEQSLHDSGEVSSAVSKLQERGYVYEKDSALWLRSTDFGDDKDRCIIRANGAPTYIASDIAYHMDKFDRGFDYLINVWGADHHGYVMRTKAALNAMGYPPDKLEIIITQIVRFVSHGKVVPMRKRDGELYCLRDLMDEVGPDVARFFYLMRSIDTHMDFDLDLAKEHSEKNPVYYVQYAHARICSLLRKAAENEITPNADGAHLLTEDPERELIIFIWELPYEILRICEDRGVHRLTTYALDLARRYHNFYDRCRIIGAETVALSRARLSLCLATKNALAKTLDILGITAPKSM